MNALEWAELKRFPLPDPGIGDRSGLGPDDISYLLFLWEEQQRAIVLPEDEWEAVSRDLDQLVEEGVVPVEQADAARDVVEQLAGDLRVLTSEAWMLAEAVGVRLVTVRPVDYEPDLDDAGSWPTATTVARLVTRIEDVVEARTGHRPEVTVVGPQVKVTSSGRPTIIATIERTDA